MFKNKKGMAVVAVFCMVVVCTSFFACSKKDGSASAGSGTEAGVVGKKKIKKAKLPTKPNAETDFEVNLTSDSKGAKVTKYLGKGGGVYIPATIQGLPVKEVDIEISRTAGVTALVVSDGCEYVRVYSDKDEYGERTVLEITNISLPDSVETYNLRNTMITEFEVPASAKKVGRLPVTLEKVSFRGVPGEIYDGAFEGSLLTSVVLPEGMKRINREVFYNCKKLVSVTLPDSIEFIGSNKGDAGVFAECTSLESINLPAKLYAVYGPAFKNCSSLTKVDIPESLLPESGELFGKVKFYDTSAFEGCNSLPLATQAQLKDLGYTWGKF
ncbi:MAG: leucine-rich repeat domain-containing protein [Spirochaetaceae bacterium]|nr:leucine-rich repeat domain-containing protein [Spirochaetaceae bacterium]